MIVSYFKKICIIIVYLILRLKLLVMKKIFITAVLLSAMVFSVSSCKKDEVEEEVTPVVKTETPEEETPVAKKATIGDFRDGGVVFWVNPDDNTKGMVVGLKGLSTSAEWGCKGTEINGADGTAIGTGAQNTKDIVKGCTTTGTAAELCANSTVDGHSDWFLPSKDALKAIYDNKVAINKALKANSGSETGIGFYWSSTEYGSNLAWCYNFGYGFWSYLGKSKTYRVRAVRAF